MLLNFNFGNRRSTVRARISEAIECFAVNMLALMYSFDHQTGNVC